MKREDTVFKSLETLQKGTLPPWPLVMGIVNLTPDSFYTGSRAQGIDEALKIAENHIEAGAHCLDLGAMSTRPGAGEINTDEEKKRLVPVLEALAKRFPQAVFSVDTYRAAVAREVAGMALMINDITAGEGDAEMFGVVAKYNFLYTMMHMRGNPRNMQEQTQYDNFPGDIINYLHTRMDLAQKSGIDVNRIWIDPGIGFAKTYEQNFALIKELKQFEVLGRPILMGISRKGFIYKTLGIEAKDALNGTTALHMACLMNGAKILRVHDVKEAMEVRELFLSLYNSAAQTI